MNVLQVLRGYVLDLISGLKYSSSRAERNENQPDDHAAMYYDINNNMNT